MAQEQGFSEEDLRIIESNARTGVQAGTPGLPSAFDLQTGTTGASAAPAAEGFSPEDLQTIRASASGEGFIAPTGSEIMTELLTGIPQGAKQAVVPGGALGGGIAGAKMGAPFFPPYGAIAGGTIGFLGGLTLGALADQQMDEFFAPPPMEELVPYREGMKTTSSIVASAPVAFGLPAGMTANRVARWLSGVGEAARAYPRSFITGESIMGLGSGLAGGAAVAYDPNSPWTRFFAEAAGGLATGPVSMAASQSGALKNFLTDFSKAFSADARQQKAANILVAGLTEAGEDPAAIVAFLNSKSARDAIKTANPTAAQLTGSPLFARLETSLSKGNANYRAEIDQQGQDALTAYKVIVKSLRDIGTPGAYQMAAMAERDFFMKMTHDRVMRAEKEAADKISKLNIDSPGARAEIGRVVKDATLDALGDARTVEKDLWTQAARDAYTVRRTGEVVPKAVRPAKITENFMYVLDGMTPERYSKDFASTLSPIMQRLGYENRFYDRFVQGKRTEEFLRTGRVPEQFVMGPKKKTANVEDLIQVRSDLLEYSRKASRAGDTNDARIYGQLAEAVLDDLSSLNTEGYRVARQYSKDLNDYFSRTYANELRATTGAGAERVPAEVLVSKVYGANSDMTAMRMQQIENAVGFIRSRYDNFQAQLQDPSLPPSEKRRIQGILTQLEPFAALSDERVTSVRDAQSRVLRLTASKAVDPTTGRVNPTRLNNFVSQNEGLLRHMGLYDDLADAGKAENLLRQTQDTFSKINEKLYKQTAFANVLTPSVGGTQTMTGLGAQLETTSSIVANALRSDKPLSAFNKLATLAKRADAKNKNTDATDGLKSIIYDYAFTKAGGMENFSPAAFEKVFLQEMAPNKPSLGQLLRSQNMMSLSEFKNLKRLIDPMKKVEAGLLRGESVDNLVAGADPVTDLALRVIGARIGTSVAPGGPGSLIAASAGSKAVRTLFDRYPNMSITKIIEDATKDPVLMRDLLQKGRVVTPRQRVEFGRRLHNYLVTAGYNAATFDEDELLLEVPETRTTGPSAAQMLSNLGRPTPPAPPTRGVPGLLTPQGQPGAQRPPFASQAQGGAPSSSRAMFQTLFPMDTVSPLLNQPR